jgi:transposase-like protein
VTKAVLERALAEEMTGHLGYEKHDPAGRGSANSKGRSIGGSSAASSTDRACWMRPIK